MLASLSTVQAEAVRKGGLAVDYREAREAADTVFRRIAYEIDKPDWPDGKQFGFDIEYGQYIGLPTYERDRWHAFRGVLHKQHRMAAGSDPSGQVQGVEGERTDANAGTKKEAPKKDGDAQETGEEVYQVSLEVFLGEESQAPFLTLSTYFPVPDSERRTTAGTTPGSGSR